MPVYKDATNNTWYCKFYYQDYKGERKQKKKRGFALQRDAKKWEADFLAKEAGSPDMKFSDLVDLYLEDKKASTKRSTYTCIESTLRRWTTPFLGNKSISLITPADIRRWQVTIKNKDSDLGKPISPRTFKTVVVTTSSVFNYGVKYYNLQENPVKKSGCIAKKPEKRLNFWTKEQFDKFASTFDNEDPYLTIFSVLYYTGCRKGELQALQAKDCDLENGVIHIDKTFTNAGGKKAVTTPKTPKSTRDVFIPPFLCDMIRDYEKRFYDLQPEDQIFYRSAYWYKFKQHTAMAGLPEIRLHDLRHSNASLLIEMGFSALLVAERLGHEDVNMTLNTYAHLWPSKQTQVVNRLQELHDLDKKKSCQT